jgi:hypothetical protein
MGFLSKQASARFSNSSSGGGYLQVSKLPDGGSVRFALLSEEPLDFFECWGTSPEGTKPGRGGPGTVDVKPAMAVPVYNFETGSVQVMSLTQKTVVQELQSISLMEDYKEILDWDFIISRKGTGLTTEYKTVPVPRRKGAQEHIDAAWIEAKSNGFDISRLLTGGNPFKAA